MGLMVLWRGCYGAGGGLRGLWWCWWFEEGYSDAGGGLERGCGDDSTISGYGGVVRMVERWWKDGGRVVEMW